MYTGDIVINKIVKFALLAWISGALIPFFTNSSLNKAVPAVFIWCAIYSVPLLWYKKSDLGCHGRMLVYLLLILALLALGKSILFPEKLYIGYVNMGNKWLTLFGNNYCLLMMLSPIFIFLSPHLYSFKSLKNANIIVLLIGLALYYISPHQAFVTFWFFSVFYAFLNKKEKLLVYAMIVAILHMSLFAEETARMYLLMLMLSVVNYILVYVVGNKKFIYIYCLALFIMPLLYMVPMLIDPNFSIFEIVLDTLSGEGMNDDFTSDTRSFLYYELAEDLTQNNAWLFGKGADAHYYSEYFDRSVSGDGDFFYRIAVEVTFLQNLLRGGIVYAVSFCFLLIYSVYKALYIGQSKFIWSVAILLSSFYFVTFIGLFSGCNLTHIGIFIFVGCCLSKRWINYTDEDIKMIMKK